MPAVRHLVGCGRCKALRNENYSIKGKAAGPSSGPFAPVVTTEATSCGSVRRGGHIDNSGQADIRCVPRSDSMSGATAAIGRCRRPPTVLLSVMLAVCKAAMSRGIPCGSGPDCQPGISSAGIDPTFIRIQFVRFRRPCLGAFDSLRLSKRPTGTLDNTG
jgi:hypothetical protein